jgi:hypothetical protein
MRWKDSCSLKKVTMLTCGKIESSSPGYRQAKKMALTKLQQHFHSEMQLEQHYLHLYKASFPDPDLYVFGLPDPDRDPLVRDTDLDHQSKIARKHFIVNSLWLFTFEEWCVNVPPKSKKQKNLGKKYFLLAFLRSLTKTAGSGSGSKSAEVGTDLEHWCKALEISHRFCWVAEGLLGNEKEHAWI